MRNEEEAVKRQREEAQRQREQELQEAREREIRENEQAALLAATIVDTQGESPSSELTPDVNQYSVNEHPPSLDTGDSFTEEILPQENYIAPTPDPSSEPPTDLSNQPLTNPNNYQWPSNDQPPVSSNEQPQESLHITATDPKLAHVLPPIVSSANQVPVDNGTVLMSRVDGLMLSNPPQSVTPSAPPPPAYDQVSVLHALS